MTDRRRFVAGLLVLATLLAACSVRAVSEVPPATSDATPVTALSTPAGARDAAAFERRRAAVAVATPIPSAAPVPVPPQPFALNLFEDGDFVPQYTFDWCVAASIQIAHNLVMPNNRAARDDQGQLWEMARARSSNSYNGANPLGWAQVLNEVGLGPYVVVSIPDYDEALRSAAAAIRETGRPVGLVMWRGRHAWVMSGFESVGDPSSHDDFSITGIRVLDPLYPYGSGTWGPSPSPNSLLTPAELAKQFVVREPRRWSSGFPTGYLMVIPVSDAVAIAPPRLLPT